MVVLEEGAVEQPELPPVQHRRVAVARPLPERLYRNAERQFGERVRILKNLPESPR